MTAGNGPTVASWRGHTTPSYPPHAAENVIHTAHSYGRPPLEGLIAAGYISASEAGQIVTTDRPVTDFSARELLDEIYRRIPEGEP